MKSAFIIKLGRLLGDSLVGLLLIGALGSVWLIGSPIQPVAVAVPSAPNLLDPPTSPPAVDPPAPPELPAKDDPGKPTQSTVAVNPVEPEREPPPKTPEEVKQTLTEPAVATSPPSSRWSGGFLIKAPGQLVNEAPPPEKVVEQLFSAPELNKFGNPEGDDYGLTTRKEFEDAELIVWSVDPEVHRNIFTNNNPLWAALREKGFRLRLESGTFQIAWTESADQMWIFSGQTSGLAKEHEDALVQFVEDGKGLYAAADNEPYLVDADRLARRLFSTRISGNYAGGNLIAVRGHGITADDFAKTSPKKGGVKRGATDERENVIRKATHYAEEHPILTDVNFIFEGVTISHLDPARELQTVLKARDGQILAAVAIDPARRVVLDCGWTRYYHSPGSYFVTETAGTVRYAENIAAYLMGKDERGAAGGDWKKWRARRRKSQEFAKLSHEQLLAAFAAKDPEDRVAAVIVAHQRKSDCAEELIELLLDPTDDVRQQSRLALQQLGGGSDYGPERRAGRDALQASRELWLEWLGRYRLVLRYETLEQGELITALAAANTMDRWAAVTVIGRKKLNLPDELIARLEDETLEVREQARQALVTLSGVDHGPASADDPAAAITVVNWKRWRLTSKYPDLFHGSEAKLVDTLKSSVPEQRWAAVTAIRTRRLKFGADLIARIDDDDRLVRREAIAALIELAGQDLGPPEDASSEQVAAAKKDWATWWKKESEKGADQAMRMAKTILENNKSAGYRRLAEIIRLYPDSEAAAEARSLVSDQGTNP